MYKEDFSLRFARLRDKMNVSARDTIKAHRKGFIFIKKGSRSSESPFVFYIAYY